MARPNRTILSLLIFVVVDTVLMEVGVVLIPTLPALNAHAFQTFPQMVAIAAAALLIESFVIAPKLRACNEGSA